MNESIDELIANNKERFEINKDELIKRIKQQLDIYLLVRPKLNLDQDLHSRLGRNYKTLHQLIIDSADLLNKGYTLDLNLTKPCGKLNIYYTKPESVQDKERTKLKKKVKELYLEELGKAKSNWLIEITEKATRKAEAEAVTQANIKSKELQTQLLHMLNSK